MAARCFMGGFPLDAVGDEPADAVVFGAPHGTPYPGIDNAPHADSMQALREALASDSDWVDHWSYDVGGPIMGTTGFRLGDLGDLPTIAQDGPRNRALIESTTREIVAAGAVPLMVGGDDSVPIPFLTGLEAIAPLTILQIDAHIDWREERRGEPFGYSSTMRRASELPHVERIVQVGMRAFGSARAGEVEAARAWGAEIVTAREVHHHGVAAVLNRIPSGANVAITIDMDAFDASLMPAVIAPSPGGLDYTQVTDLIAGVADRGRIAAFDMIEFVPARDVGGSAALTAAYLLQFAVGVLANRAPR
jgi:agmatinase